MSYLAHWWDVALFLVLSVFHVGGWWEIRQKLAQDPKNDETSRSSAASTMSGASTAGITAVTVLIPASLLIVQIGNDAASKMPPQALDNVFRASLWFLISLLFGLIIVFLIPMRGQKHNVARDLWVGIPFGPQLLALLVGMGRLVMGLYAAIYK